MPPQDERIEELEDRIEELSSLLSDAIDDISELTKELNSHEHEIGAGRTTPLEGRIELKPGMPFSSGNSHFAGSTPELTPDLPIYALLMGTGPVDASGDFVSDSTRNTQLTLQHQPGGLHFFYGFSGPVFSESGLTINSGSNKITSNRYSFEHNELAGNYINLFNGAVFTDTLRVVSNTAKEITLSEPISFSSSNLSYVTYDVVYDGSANNPWQRGYVMDGAAGGLRFGPGPTGAGRNGLLYMDANGRLIWRRPDGNTVTLD